MSKKNTKYLYGMDYGIIPQLIGAYYDFADKANNATAHAAYMLNRTQSIFKYDGLPDSIPARNLELYLQTNGNVCFYEHNGLLYVFTGGLGGEPNAYYMPTVYTISNPALSLFVNADIDINCVVIPNDSMYLGLLPLFNRYASALVENELSMNIAAINARVIDFISASDDATKASAEKYLKDIADGKQGVIGENAFLNGIKVQPAATAGVSAVTNLIEYEQYLKASWYNEIGLNANYNMKRESINSGESQLNNDMLMPLIDNMLECRRVGLEKVNAMFGTNISVSLNSSWERNQKEIDVKLTDKNDGGADNVNVE